MKFHERLREARRKANITQVQLAKECNVSQGTIANWESGYRTPDLDMLKKIALFLDVSYDDLLGDKIVEAVFDGKITPENLDMIKEKAPDISRSDLEAIMSQLDESEIDQMIDYAQYLLSKKAIRFVPEDQSNK